MPQLAATDDRDYYRMKDKYSSSGSSNYIEDSWRVQFDLAPMPGLSCINTLNQFRFCHWGTCATVSSDIHFDPGGPKHPLRIFTGPTGDLTRKGERGAM